MGSELNDGTGGLREWDSWSRSSLSGSEWVINGKQKRRKGRDGSE